MAQLLLLIGWAHNFDISVSRLSDPYVGMGEGSPTSAAAAIAAIYVSQDLITNTPCSGSTLCAQNLTIAWVINRWLTDQLTNNAVLVSWPNTSEEFIWLPHEDGSSSVNYSAPLGSATILTGSVPDTYGNFTTFTYRNKDQSQLSFSALNSSLVGQLASWTMPYDMSVGFTYGYSYGGNSYLSTITNNLGRSLTLNYSGAHVSSVVDDTGRSVSYGYDTNNNFVSFRDPLSYQTTFAYDGSASHLTQIFYPSNPLNAFVTNAYDGLGRVSQQANANGNTYTFYFAGSRSETVDPASNRHVTYQTARGSVLKDDWVLSGSSNVYNDTPTQTTGGLILDVTAHQYDGQERLTLTTAPEGGTTAYTYSSDFFNNIMQITNAPKPGSPLSPLTTTFTYDPTYNKTTSITDPLPLGLVTTLRYDPSTGNLLTKVADVGGTPHFNAITNFTYNGVGQVQTSTDPLGVITQYGYDSRGNQTSITRDYGTGRLNQLTSIAYDGLGDVVSVIDPNGNTAVNIFDAERHLTGTIAPPGASGAALTTAFTYDPDGHLLQTQQSGSGAILRTTSATYTLTGQVANATDASGSITRYTYDSVDQLASTTDPVGNVTSYGYDALSRQISIGNLAIQSTPLLQKAFTPDGMLASLTDANSNATVLAYDGFDRLSSTTYPDGSSEALSYDTDSNIVSRATRKGDPISYGYDSLNRLCTKTIGVSATACGTGGSGVTDYSYDLAGRLIAANDSSASVAAVSGTSASYVTSTAYDSVNHPVSATWNPAASQSTPTASSVTFTHGYDQNNRRVTHAANDNSWLSYPGSASTVSYTANSLNQYSAVGAVTPTYDGNGNLTYDGAYTYCYDTESRLIEVRTSGSCGAASPVATYAYDAQGRRKSKTVGGTTTNYVTDADNREVLEYNGSGATQHWYSYGAGPDEVLNQMNVAGGTRATLIPDIQGSIIGSLDSGGTLTKIGYQTYGENAALASNGYYYTARRFDPESSLYYYRSRMYCPPGAGSANPIPSDMPGGSISMPMSITTRST